MPDGSRVERSPIASLNSNQLRSRSLPQHQTVTLDWITNPTQGSRSDNYDSHGGNTLAVLPLEMAINTSRTASISSAEGSLTDPWEGISRGSLASDHSTLSVGEEVFSNVGSLPVSMDEKSEKGSVLLPSVHKSEEELQFSPSLELVS